MVIVPGTLALLQEYASIEDPVADLRRTVDDAVAWLVEEEPARFTCATPAAHRIAEQVLGDRFSADGPGLLVVANGSATRTEKAPGHFDERAAEFDAAIGTALAEGDPAALATIDLALADELWALPDADVLRTLGDRVGRVTSAQVDHDDAPYGVQYWVVRWEVET
ncbi:MAG TPA: hypothetical protein VFE07_06200 [Marmoricola sp.]|jgi:hypothetical protein|nr:hypothetical protein [Marmoricola sp.]